jgi:ABC-type dipeptide/oligopeptide/nickel transport system ATPase component
MSTVRVTLTELCAPLTASVAGASMDVELANWSGLSGLVGCGKSLCCLSG